MYVVSKPSPETDVLVVGGSLVGLSAAMFLAWHGVRVTVVEKHAGSSPHPRAIGYTSRTLELFRSVGLTGIPETPSDFRLTRAKIHSLAGEWFERTTWTPQSAGHLNAEFSPSPGAGVAQDFIEPLLRKRATELGAHIIANTEFVSFTQDDTGVVAIVKPRDASAAYEIRASYLIAADGASSGIREALGIARTGRGYMNTVRSVLFRAPLEEYLQHGVQQFEIEQPDLTAFLTTYNDGRWVLMFTDDRERNDDELRAAITQAIGRSDVPIEIITTGRWELSALVAERFSDKRVFLAGDAAHQLPPTRGGFGANTGIADAHNLAWKIAAVLAGTSAPSLLESYDCERRPVAQVRHDQIFVRPDYAKRAGDVPSDGFVIDDDAMEYGALYRSAVIIGTDEQLPPALRPDQWAGQPGTRAPHVWIDRDGERRSTLDYFGTTFVLLALSHAWKEAAESLQLPSLACLDAATEWTATDRESVRIAFGIGRSGAVLVRPDGVIAWRSADLPSDPRASLRDAFSRCATHERERIEDDSAY